jgi:hypothetical protein
MNVNGSEAKASFKAQSLVSRPRKLYMYIEPRETEFMGHQIQGAKTRCY